MQNWIISANPKMYDHTSAFAKWGYIDWRQDAKFMPGDIVYIYRGLPYQKVMYKTRVVKESMTFSECTDDREYWYNVDEYEKAKGGRYARLALIDQSDNDNLLLPLLKQHGLKGAPQKQQRISDELANYIDQYLKDDYSRGVFPESDLPQDSYEGAVISTVVNRFERSSMARQKCIEYHGYECSICGMSFEKIYGEIGKGFIHVHHIIPLNSIGKEYVVNFKNDLIPVCPNCHAMLHRTMNGESITIEQLRNIVRGNLK